MDNRDWIDDLVDWQLSGDAHSLDQARLYQRTVNPGKAVEDTPTWRPWHRGFWL